MPKYIFTFGGDHLRDFDVKPMSVALVIEAESEGMARDTVAKVEGIGMRFAFSYNYEDKMAKFKEDYGMLEYTLNELLAKRRMDVPASTVNTMTEQQYLLVCLMEELSEAAQEVAKCLRFTTTHTPVGTYTTSNFERLELELADVEAIQVMLSNTGLVFTHNSPSYLSRVNDKIRRTRETMLIAKDLGTLEQ